MMPAGCMQTPKSPGAVSWPRLTPVRPYVEVSWNPSREGTNTCRTTNMTDPVAYHYPEMRLRLKLSRHLRRLWKKAFEIPLLPMHPACELASGYPCDSQPPLCSLARDARFDIFVLTE